MDTILYQKDFQTSLHHFNENSWLERNYSLYCSRRKKTTVVWGKIKNRRYLGRNHKQLLLREKYVYIHICSKCLREHIKQPLPMEIWEAGGKYSCYIEGIPNRRHCLKIYKKKLVFEENKIILYLGINEKQLLFVG